jgi:hypothetical protein
MSESDVRRSGGALRAAALAVLCVLAAGGERAHGVDSKTVAIFPVGRSRGDSVLDQRFLRVDTLVRRNVETQGFNVVPADTVLALFKHLSDSMGGIYDTMTGKPDSARTAELTAALGRDLVARYHVDLKLRPSLEIQYISFSGGKAHWCGAENKTGAPGGFLSIAGTYSGKLPGLTLVVAAYDGTDKKVYSECGGIQLVAHVKKGLLAPVPSDSIMIDSNTVSYAVHVALDSLGARVGVERAAVPAH